MALKADQFIPGHGNVQTKDDIQQRLNKAEDKRAKIKGLVAQGKSLEEIRAAVGDAPPAQGHAGEAPFSGPSRKSSTANSPTNHPKSAMQIPDRARGNSARRHAPGD